MTPMLESRGGASAVRYQPDSSQFRVAVIGLGNAGHMLHHDQPEILADIIEGFLA